MDKVDVETIDVCDELRIRIEFRLGLPPVVILFPIVGEFLHRRELDALRRIFNQFLLRPLGCRDPPAQILETILRYVDVEWTYCFGWCGSVIFRLRGRALGNAVLLLNSRLRVRRLAWRGEQAESGGAGCNH